MTLAAEEKLAFLAYILPRRKVPYVVSMRSGRKRLGQSSAVLFLATMTSANRTEAGNTLWAVSAPACRAVAGPRGR